MRRIMDLALGGIVAFSLFGCGAHQVGSVQNQQAVRETATRSNSQESTSALPQTGYSEAVPTTYLQPSSRPGAVERLDYASFDYAGSGNSITKTAYVYTPYGYDAGDTSTRYDIVYLMHGWGGHAGEYFEMAGIKDLLDNLIERGNIAPTIFVSATFYHAGSDGDFGSSVAELRAFYQDFENHLMPAVEGAYHTYAATTDAEGLAASRNHRAFGGFSLGAVTTWMTFCHDYDYIRYFLPMSGSCWYFGGYGNFQTERNVDYIKQLVEEHDLNRRGYLVYEGVGSNDPVREQTLRQMDEMLSRDGSFPPEHLLFYQKHGGGHDFEAVREFMYNALPLFFQDTTA